MLWSDIMTTVTLIKEKHLIGVAYIFRGLVYCHLGVNWWRAVRHGARGGAENPTSCCPQATESGLSITLTKASVNETSSHPPQWHTSSNKAILPNNTTPCDIMKVSYIQITIHTVHSAFNIKSQGSQAFNCWWSSMLLILTHLTNGNAMELLIIYYSIRQTLQCISYIHTYICFPSLENINIGRTHQTALRLKVQVGRKRLTYSSKV